MENRNASKNLLSPRGSRSNRGRQGIIQHMPVPGGVALTSPADTTTKYFSGFSAAITPSFFKTYRKLDLVILKLVEMHRPANKNLPFVNEGDSEHSPRNQIVNLKIVLRKLRPKAR